MFPIRDDNPGLLTPYATIALIVLNVGAWVVLQGLGLEPALSRSVCTLGLIPGDLLNHFSPGTVLRLSDEVSCVASGGAAWYTPLTSMFLHGGWLHLIGNMWFMWIFGNNVEDIMGPVRFVIFYLLSGLAAAGLQVLSQPESAVPMVGASGAIGGVMGAYIVLFPRVHVHLLVFLGFFVTTVAVPAVLMLGYWFLLQLIGGWGATGASGGVAFWAHVGGFAAGALLVLVFQDRRLVARHPYHGWAKQRLPSRSWQRVDHRR